MVNGLDQPILQVRLWATPFIWVGRKQHLKKLNLFIKTPHKNSYRVSQFKNKLPLYLISGHFTLSSYVRPSQQWYLIKFEPCDIATTHGWLQLMLYWQMTIVYYLPHLLWLEIKVYKKRGSMWFKASVCWNSNQEAWNHFVVVENSGTHLQQSKFINTRLPSPLHSRKVSGDCPEDKRGLGRKLNRR